MEIAQEYIIEKQLDYSVLNKINIVRLWKKVYLPVELVGCYRKNKTKAYEHINEISITKWSFPFTTVPKPRDNQIIQWNRFLEWLYNLNHYTVYDFKEFRTSTMRIIDNNKYLIINGNNTQKNILTNITK